MDWYFITGPLKGFKKTLTLICQSELIHVQQWAYTIEKGKRSDYQHYHLKICCSGDNVFEKLRLAFHPGHVEKSNGDLSYLRKPGNDRYLSSIDTPEILETRRVGQLRVWQKKLCQLLKKQSVRQVLAVIDEQGNSGKTFLTLRLFETKQAFWCPPVLSTPKDIVQFITSGYDQEEFIIIDIPRSWKWSKQLYTVIEMIKDGLIFDTRYKCTMRNIRGVKLAVFANSWPKLDRLSADRWVITTPQELEKRAAHGGGLKVKGPFFRNTSGPLDFSLGNCITSSKVKDVPPGIGGTVFK